MTNRIPTASQYFDAVRQILDQIVATQSEAIAQTAAAVLRTIQADGMIYLFGTGHSHMMAEEGHFRAGGLAPVCPMLYSGLMLHEGGEASGRLERTNGIAQIVFDRYRPTANDMLIVFSNSGVNTAPVEMAMIAKEQGMTVAAVVSLQYVRQTPAGGAGAKLPDVVDILIDNQGPPGDAGVEIGGTGLHSGSLSTVTGAFILNAILTEVVGRIAATGTPPPVFISANMPGASEHNQALFDTYRSRNPHM